MTTSDAAPPAGPPSRLYKYRSLAKGKPRQRTLAILKNLELYYSPGSDFNDPFDCNLDIAFRTSEDWEKLFGNALDRIASGLSNWKAKMDDWLRARAAEKGSSVPPRPPAHPK